MGWFTDEQDRKKGTVTTTPFYLAAFESGLYTVWGGTPFENEISDLAQARAYSCLLSSEEHYVHLSRSLTYHYLAGEFGTEPEDVLPTYYRQLPISFPFQQILDETFAHYRQRPKRTVGDAKGTLHKKIGELYASAGVDAKLAEVVPDAGLSSCIAVRPVWRNNRLDIDTLMPDIYRVRTDEKDPYTATELVTVITERDEKGKRAFRLQHWTPERITTRDGRDWDKVVREVPNPYGRLPFAFLRLRPSGSFYGQGDWDLVERTMSSRRMEFLANLDVGNSFGMWIAQNLDISDTKPLKIGPGRVITLEGVDVTGSGNGDAQPGELENVTSNGQYIEMETAREQRNRETKRDRNLPPSMIDPTTGTPPSGYSLFLSRTSLIEAREKYREGLLRFEKELAPVMMTVANVDSAGRYRFSDSDLSGDVSVDYADPSVIMEPPEEMEYDRGRMKDGLISPMEFVRKWGQLDTTLTVEQAAAEVAKNREDYTKIFGNDNDRRSSNERLSGGEPGGSGEGEVPEGPTGPEETDQGPEGEGR